MLARRLLYVGGAMPLTATQILGEQKAALLRQIVDVLRDMNSGYTPDEQHAEQCAQVVFASPNFRHLIAQYADLKPSHAKRLAFPLANRREVDDQLFRRGASSVGALYALACGRRIRTSAEYDDCKVPVYVNMEGTVVYRLEVAGDADRQAVLQQIQEQRRARQEPGYRPRDLLAARRLRL